MEQAPFWDILGCIMGPDGALEVPFVTKKDFFSRPPGGPPAWSSRDYTSLYVHCSGRKTSSAAKMLQRAKIRVGQNFRQGWDCNPRREVGQVKDFL